MNTAYLPDRIPVTPLGVVVGDRIFLVHVEGEADRQIDVTVTAVGAELLETGHYKVTIGYLAGGDDKAVSDLTEPADLVDGDDEDPANALPTFKLDDPGSSVSVAFPRPDVHVAPNVFEVAA